jgi:hypothetical protein
MLPAQEFDTWGGRGFHKFADVPMRRSAAEFLLRAPLSDQGAGALPGGVRGALAARLAALDAAIAAAAAEPGELRVGAPPAALPAAHAAWWLFAGAPA